MNDNSSIFIVSFFTIAVGISVIVLIVRLNTVEHQLQFCRDGAVSVNTVLFNPKTNTYITKEPKK